MNGAADGELKRKVEDYKARERIYLAGLVGQEAEMNSLRRMASDVLGAYGDVSRAGVRGGLVDPTANMEVLLLRQKLREKEQQIGQLREDLQANRFDQRTSEGQAVMSKCKALLAENRELGDNIREDRLVELRAGLRSEKLQNDQLLHKLNEASSFCKELQQENDTLQGTISKVAFRLREARDELAVVSKTRADVKAKKKKEKEQQKAAQEQAQVAVQAMTPTLQPPPNFPSGSSRAEAPGALDSLIGEDAEEQELRVLEKELHELEKREGVTQSRRSEDKGPLDRLVDEEVGRAALALEAPEKEKKKKKRKRDKDDKEGGGKASKSTAPVLP